MNDDNSVSIFIDGEDKITLFHDWSINIPRHLLEKARLRADSRINYIHNSTGQSREFLPLRLWVRVLLGAPKGNVMRVSIRSDWCMALRMIALHEYYRKQQEFIREVAQW